MRGALAAGAALVLVGGLAPMVSPVSTVGGVVAAAADVAAVPFDFNGDGYADLAVGVRGEGLRGKSNAGAVQVLYGSASGVTDHDQFWHQGRKGVKGAVEADDRFGSALDSGDFDADGYADLAIGIPGEDLRGAKDAGAVQVLYGSSGDLTAAGDQVWHQGKKGVPGSNQRGDRFGDVLAVGDFDGDGYADLAVGVTGEDLGGAKNVGQVVVLRGSAAGLTAAGAQAWNQSSPGIASTRLAKERFGDSLASGDVTNDARDDLVIGTLHEWDSSTPDDRSTGNRGGALHLLPGSPTGLTASGSQYFNLGALNLPVRQRILKPWLGDVNADGHDDLALGANSLDPNIRGEAVILLHGHADGFHPGPLAAPGMPGKDTMWPEGLEAASGDFTGDGYADLALGSWRIVVGTSAGLGPQTVGCGAGGGSSDTLNALPLSGGTHLWLVIGLPENSSGRGSVLVMRCNDAGFDAVVWTQDSPKIKNVAEDGDLFGTVGNRVTFANP